MRKTIDFTGTHFVVRVDDATALDERSTLIDDLHVLIERDVHPIVVAPGPAAARTLVRSMNRSTNIAVGLSGHDAALLPQGPSGIGTVQARILETLTSAGYVPVVEPTAFAVFGDDDTAVLADDVAAAIASACCARRAIFLNDAGALHDPDTLDPIDRLTAAEALALADDVRLPAALRDAMRAAALGVRAGIPAAQIVDGRVAHAIVAEVLTLSPVGTQVTGGLILAA